MLIFEEHSIFQKETLFILSPLVLTSILSAKVVCLVCGLEPKLPTTLDSMERGHMHTTMLFTV